MYVYVYLIVLRNISLEAVKFSKNTNDGTTMMQRAHANDFTKLMFSRDYHFEKNGNKKENFHNKFYVLVFEYI